MCKVSISFAPVLFLCIHITRASLAVTTHQALPLTETNAITGNANVAIEVENTAAQRDCRFNRLEDLIYCYVARAARNALYSLSQSNRPIVIVRGLEIVPSKDHFKDGNVTTADFGSGRGATTAENMVTDSSFLERVSQYLRSHELNLKFSDLFAEENEQFNARSLEWYGRNLGLAPGMAEEARKKDKGQGLILMMAMMFGKMMAVMGLGGIGAMAVKALGVAMAALMMAGIVGLKTLSQHGSHDAGHSHSVQYVAAEGHHHKRRRRRSLNGMPIQQHLSPVAMAYRGWHGRRPKHI